MWNLRYFLLTPLLACAQGPPPAATPGDAKNVVVYRQEGRYAGWPANHGIWSWGNEIVVGFELGYHDSNSGIIHTISFTKPEEHLLARSLDGGESWKVEKPLSLRPPAGIKVGSVPVEDGGKQPVACPGGIPFTHPDFAMTIRTASMDDGPSRFYYSTDRGRNWKGPFIFPGLGTPGIIGRTSYAVEGPRQCTVFLTAAKPNHKEGRPICARTSDGGKSWELIGWIGPEPEGYAIQPSGLRLDANHLLAAFRRNNPAGADIPLFESSDNGSTWAEISRIAGKDNGSNPPSMVRLKDGRICVTYGRRTPPFGIRARISADEGKSWGDEMVLRNDGGHRDLGYTRTVQRTDGKLVTLYYFNDRPDTERYIGATIWTPPAKN